MTQEGEVRFLICTDVAARGIDVSGIPFVINVTLPDEKVGTVRGNVFACMLVCACVVYVRVCVCSREV